jgi:hypothetical protein
VQVLQAGRSAAERMADVLHAINWLDEHLGTKPERAHRVEQWVVMSGSQKEALGKAGVITLGNLVDWMSLQGATAGTTPCLATGSGGRKTCWRGCMRWNAGAGTKACRSSLPWSPANSHLHRSAGLG